MIGLVLIGNTVVQLDNNQQQGYQTKQTNIANVWCLAHGDTQKLIDDGFACNDGYRATNAFEEAANYGDSEINELKPFFRSIAQTCKPYGGVYDQDPGAKTFTCNGGEAVVRIVRTPRATS